MLFRVVLCALAAALGCASAANLCYRVTWDMSSKPAKTQLLRPVTAFPAQHVLANKTMCGVTRRAGYSVRQ